LNTAAKIAGLSILSFIHENTAAALYFGVERKDENSTLNILYYNIGAYNI